MGKAEIMRANRLHGNSFERRLQTDLRKNIELAQRSAGSHSPVDIWCIDKYRLFLIQAKGGVSRPKKEKDLLVRYANNIKRVFPIDCHNEGGRRVCIDLESGHDWSGYLLNSPKKCPLKGDCLFWEKDYRECMKGYPVKECPEIGGK